MPRMNAPSLAYPMQLPQAECGDVTGPSVYVCLCWLSYFLPTYGLFKCIIREISDHWASESTCCCRCCSRCRDVSTDLWGLGCPHTLLFVLNWYLLQQQQNSALGPLTSFPILIGVFVPTVVPKICWFSGEEDERFPKVLNLKAVSS